MNNTKFRLTIAILLSLALGSIMCMVVGPQ